MSNQASSRWTSQDKKQGEDEDDLALRGGGNDDADGSDSEEEDGFPGARDIDTPYGSVRAYEFGPEGGAKVLLIHGITSSSLCMKRVAWGLVRRGCRVMLFDLFGRGLSDGVADLPHDARLYVSQILCVLASSRLAVHFALACPHLVASLVLLAPGGLIRLSPSAAALRLFFISRIIPEFLRVGIAARILRRQPSPLSSSTAEAAPLGHPPRPCLRERVTAFTAWMASHHPGLVPAVIFCFRFAPLMHQHDSWRRLAARSPGSTAIFLAADDNIIDSDDLTRQGLPLLGGSDRFVWKILPGTHEFIITHADPFSRSLTTSGA